MARTAIATLQTAWDCRWSRPAFHVERPGGIKHLEETWVCTRDGQPRVIDPHDCETCPFFELQPDGTASAAVVTHATTTAGALSLTAPRRLTVDRLLYVAACALIALSAAVFFTVGLSILTTPLALPVTLTLWLAAAAIVGFAVTGGLPHPD